MLRETVGGMTDYDLLLVGDIVKGPSSLGVALKD
jgi:hypothetical protein